MYVSLHPFVLTSIMVDGQASLCISKEKVLVRSSVSSVLCVKLLMNCFILAAHYSIFLLPLFLNSNDCLSPICTFLSSDSDIVPCYSCHLLPPWFFVLLKHFTPSQRPSCRNTTFLYQKPSLQPGHGFSSLHH